MKQKKANRALLEKNKKKLKKNENAAKMGESIDIEALMTESKHRLERSKNVIVYNLEDTNDVFKDTENLEKLMENVRLELQMLSVVRLGKYDKRKPRPLKISFPSKKRALLLLKYSSKLTSHGVRVTNDMTKSLQEFLKNIRDELKHRIENGEEYLTMKFIKNVPE